MMPLHAGPWSNGQWNFGGGSRDQCRGPRRQESGLSEVSWEEEPRTDRTLLKINNCHSISRYVVGRLRPMSLSLGDWTIR